MNLFDVQRMRVAGASKEELHFYIGRNYALLGMSEEKLKDRWHTEVDVGALRDHILNGYRSDELPVGEKLASVSRHYDGKFLMNTIASQLPDWEDRGYAEVHTDDDSYFVPGVGSSFYKLLVHKKMRLAAIVSFSNHINPEGEANSHYSLRIGYVLDVGNAIRRHHDVKYLARAVSDCLKDVSQLRYCGGSHSWEPKHQHDDVYQLEVVGASLEYNYWTKGEPGTKEIVKTLKALSECLKIGYPIYEGSIPLKKYLPFVSPNYVHKAYDDKVFWASFNTGS